MDTNISLMTGFVTNDPVLKEIGENRKVCEFGVAVHGIGDNVSFFTLKSFNRLGELCQRYLKKGSRVLAQGKLRQERWESEGKKAQKIILIADSVQFIGNKVHSESDSHSPESEPLLGESAA